MLRKGRMVIGQNIKSESILYLYKLVEKTRLSFAADGQ